MFTRKLLEKFIRRVAIRYIGRDYDKAELEQLLDGSKQPHPVHEEPLIQAFIAGAKWAEACRKKQGELKTQMEYEDHRCDKTLYGQFQELLNTLSAMSGCSNYLHWSQQIKEEKSSFNGFLYIDDGGNVNIELSLEKMNQCK